MLTSSSPRESLQTNAWLAHCKPNPAAKLRLFCFPYAGGGAIIYRDWHENLPAAVECWPIELPGRGRRMREGAFTRVAPLVRELAQVLLPHLNKPFAFFGHSMGALIGFELAVLLLNEHRLKPLRLFVSSRRAPQCPQDDLQTYNLPEPEFIADLRRLDGTPKEVLEHPELLQLLLPVLRSDFELCQTYEYTRGTLLETPITALGGELDMDVSREQLEGWRERTAAEFKMHILPGGHFYLQNSRESLFRILNQDLHTLIGHIVCRQAL